MAAGRGIVVNRGPASILRRAFGDRKRSNYVDPWTGHGLPPQRARTPRVVAAFVTVWIGVTLAHMASSSFLLDLWMWAFVGSFVLGYMVVVGIPVYLVMDYWGKRSIIWYTAAGLAAGVPIGLSFLSTEGWMAVGLYAALAGVCGLIGYWIVERT